MHGIADEHQTSRQARSGSIVRAEALGKPRLRDARKPRVTAEIIHAFDRQAPQRDPGKSPSADRPAPVSPAIRRHDDGHLFAYNGTTYDIGSMINSSPDAESQFFRNGTVHDLRNLLQILSSGVSVAPTDGLSLSAAPRCGSTRNRFSTKPSRMPRPPNTTKDHRHP